MFLSFLLIYWPQWESACWLKRQQRQLLFCKWQCECAAPTFFTFYLQAAHVRWEVGRSWLFRSEATNESRNGPDLYLVRWHVRKFAHRPSQHMYVCAVYTLSRLDGQELEEIINIPRYDTIWRYNIPRSFCGINSLFVSGNWTMLSYTATDHTWSYICRLPCCGHQEPCVYVVHIHT